MATQATASTARATSIWREQVRAGALPTEAPSIIGVKPLSVVLNVIWIVIAGCWLCLSYIVAGILGYLFIITIPFGHASFRIARFVIWPFGREVVVNPRAGAGSALGNVLWFFIAGLWLAFGHVVTAFGLAITIVGIPFAWANLKMISLICFPLGKQIVAS